jgi:hypothetical protein
MMDDAEVRALAERLPAMGAPIGLEVDPAYRPGVAAYLAELLDAAALLAGFPLPDDVEPAPVFEP